MHENESIYIPIGAVHRLENPGKILLELIEVQTGSYLGEDDIIRIEDDYQRRSLNRARRMQAMFQAAVRRFVSGACNCLNQNVSGIRQSAFATFVAAC